MMFDQKLNAEQRQAELKPILTPVPGDQPAGPDFRTTPEGRELTRQIESQFRSAIMAERKLEEYRLLPDETVTPPPEPNWNQFLQEAIEFLSGKSRDLIVATFLTEAGVREYGVRGLLVGLELLTGMVETFGMSVNPQQDAETTRDRRFSAWRQAYEWASKLAPRLDSLCRLTSTGTTFADYVEAVKLDDPQLKFQIREARIQNGAKTTETIRSEIKQGEAYFRNLYSDLQQSRKVVQKLISISKEKFVPPDPNSPIPIPDFTCINDGLMKMISKVKEIAPPALIVEEAEQNSSAGANAAASGATDEGEVAVSTGSSVPSIPKGQMTRELAFAQLQQLADFFRRTEPHSPMSYNIEQTIRWGKMSLPELFTELIGNAESRRALFERTGLPNQE